MYGCVCVYYVGVRLDEQPQVQILHPGARERCVAQLSSDHPVKPGARSVLQVAVLPAVIAMPVDGRPPLWLISRRGGRGWVWGVEGGGRGERTTDIWGCSEWFFTEIQ